MLKKKDFFKNAFLAFCIICQATVGITSSKTLSAHLLHTLPENTLTFDLAHSLEKSKKFDVDKTIKMILGGAFAMGAIAVTSSFYVGRVKNKPVPPVKPDTPKKELPISSVPEISQQAPPVQLPPTDEPAHAEEETTHVQASTEKAPQEEPYSEEITEEKEKQTVPSITDIQIAMYSELAYYDSYQNNKQDQYKGCTKAAKDAAATRHIRDIQAILEACDLALVAQEKDTYPQLFKALLTLYNNKRNSWDQTIKGGNTPMPTPCTTVRT